MEDVQQKRKADGKILPACNLRCGGVVSEIGVSDVAVLVTVPYARLPSTRVITSACQDNEFATGNYFIQYRHKHAPFS